MPPNDSPEYPNPNQPLSRARSLRRNQTPAEAQLWYRLNNRQLGGYKFRRQHAVGPYILDFYCPTGQLAVELDGSQHADADALSRDDERAQYLAGLGIRVIRFWNYEVLTEMDSVLKRIANALEIGGGRE
ncbi:MAG: endonuclease domain-containing protein [Anaerolineae bacterium]